LGEVYKIVVTGPFNSGKTTFISAISEIEVVSTEKLTRSSSGGKDLTTVAMDFGRITLPDGYVIHLYGTPGQDRFDFMWEILSEGMLGYVVLLDGTQPSSFEEGRRFIETFGSMSDAPFVVGLTRADSRHSAAAESVEVELDAQERFEVVACDARSVKDVKDVLIRLLELVVERTEVEERAG